MERFMQTDIFTLSDPVTRLTINAPNRFTEQELEAVKEFIAIRIRSWERTVIEPPKPVEPDIADGEGRN